MQSEILSEWYKFCKSCLRELPLDSFALSKEHSHGRTPKCRECYSLYHKEYYQKNKDKLRKKTRDWYSSDDGKRIQRETNKQYRQKFPEVHRVSNSKRKQHIQEATPKWLTDKHWEEIRTLYKQASTKLHVDHIIPIRGKNVCGLHVPWNMQLLSASENCSKGNKFHGNT